ncbi:MAG: hypothetical protein JKY34_08695 [Kordiimonadaceae bacterium]|nr:hypothetical protein [Kordiimonadaceae bacterium]
MDQIDPDTKTREAIKSWMTHVLGGRFKSAEQWSKQAGVSPTSITRTLKGGSEASLPGAKIIGRLADAAGSQPNFIAAVPIRSVPVMEAEEIVSMLQNDLEVPADKHELVPVPESEDYSSRTFAMRVESETMTAVGIFPGDKLIVDPERPPVNGDIVLVMSEKGMAPYRYQPPHFFPYAIGGAHEVLAIGGKTMIGGVAIHHQRSLSSLFESS